jgi:hypothetical protein
MFCLTAGAIATTLAAQSFTLSWTHSVQKTEIQEEYSTAGDKLLLTEARIQSSGAGFDPPPSAQLSGGWWRWRPATQHEKLTLARAAAPGDWRICVDGVCRPLSEYIAAPGETAIEITACPAER